MKRILIVDDKEENLYLLQFLLQNQGYEVLRANHGSSALEVARQYPPDIIITDILMPIMDGFALCREWKKDKRLKSIPFVFYTATYTDERDQKFALGLGADKFIVKPQEPDIFLSIVQKLIQKFESLPADPIDGLPVRISPEEPKENDAVYLKQYNEALIRKLESKMEELERINRELEQDIATRKKTEEALRKSEEQSQCLLNAAPEGIFVQSEGKFVYLNPAMLKLFGVLKQDDLLGTQIMERIAPEYHEIVRERIRLQRQTGKPVPLMQQEYLDVDGLRIFVETTAVPIRFQERDAHLVFVRDISERKRAEQEKVELEEQLRQSQKLEAIGQLAGGVAHDFNNILFVVMGYCDLALDQLHGNDATAEKINEIVKCSEQGARLTRQLLAFSRKQVLAPKVLDMNRIVLDVENMLRRLIGEDIDLKAVLDPNLGRVKADPGQIEQMILNLALNSRDAMPLGGKLIIETANVSFDETHRDQPVSIVSGPYVTLAVTDTGCGMDETTKKHIFEPFFTTKEKGKGTGLGLSTVYGIVKQSGGEILCDSEPGKGTSFKVYLPRVWEESLPENMPQKNYKAAGCTETILIAEDEKAIRNLLREALESVGYKTILAATGEESLLVCKEYQGPIHLVITDVVMPGMSGNLLAKSLKELRPGIKILYSSGHTDNAFFRQDILENGSLFLQKPYNLGTLYKKIREVLDS